VELVHTVRKESTLLTLDPSAGFTEYEIADTCTRAARRLRAGPASAAASQRAGLDSSIADLLDAIGSTVALDSKSLPEEVQRATLRVARQVVVGREHRDIDERHDHAGRVRADMGWRAVRGEAVPFATSIQLGRMG
jgi:hypothetical protein